MSDDLTPDDRFEANLSAALHAAASEVDGTGVTRDGVSAVLSERRRRHTRAIGVVSVAAAIAIVVAITALMGADGGGERLRATGSTTTVAPDPCAPPSPQSWVGWFDLTYPQLDELEVAGLLTSGEVELVRGTAQRVTVEEWQVLARLADDPATELWAPSGDQIWDMGMRDPETGELDPARTARPTGPIRLTPSQRWVLGIRNPEGQPAVDLTNGAEVSLTREQLQMLRANAAGLTAEQGQAIIQGAFPGPLVQVPGYQVAGCSTATSTTSPSTSTSTSTSTGG